MQWQHIYLLIEAPRFPMARCSMAPDPRRSRWLRDCVFISICRCITEGPCHPFDENRSEVQGTAQRGEVITDKLNATIASQRSPRRPARKSAHQTSQGDDYKEGYSMKALAELEDREHNYLRWLLNMDHAGNVRVQRASLHGAPRHYRQDWSNASDCGGHYQGGKWNRDRSPISNQSRTEERFLSEYVYIQSGCRCPKLSTSGRSSK